MTVGVARTFVTKALSSVKHRNKKIVLRRNNQKFDIDCASEFDVVT